MNFCAFSPSAACGAISFTAARESLGGPSKEACKRRGLELLEREDIVYPLIYVPICIGAVLMDLVESVCDTCVAMRIAEMKDVTRVMRRCMGDYERYYSSALRHTDGLAPIEAWKESFLNSTNGDSANFSQINEELKRRYPELDPDWRATVASATLALAYTNALIGHCAFHESRFARMLDLPDRGSMLPRAVFALPKLLELVVGDKPLPKESIDVIVADIRDLMDELGESPTEPDERTAYRHKCIAFQCNGGCRRHAINGEYGCFPSSDCARMRKWDEKHKTEKKSWKVV